MTNPLPVPPPIQTLIDLFTTSLSDVRFADVDGQTLARLAAEVGAAAELLVAAQSALDAASAALQGRQETLLQHAQRALSYARVYAEADEALSAQLDTITLPRPSRRSRTEEVLVLSASAEVAPRRPRGRPKRGPATEPAARPAQVETGV